MLSKLVIFSAIVALSYARIYDKCEFVHEIVKYGVPSNDLAVWSCIAKHESEYNTAARNTNTGDHGIVQISEIYWCNAGDAPGKGCNARCSDFENDDISDDMRCAMQVWNEWQGSHGNGFMAWTTYQPYCAGDVSQYIAGC